MLRNTRGSSSDAFDWHRTTSEAVTANAGLLAPDTSDDHVRAVERATRALQHIDAEPFLAIWLSTEARDLVLLPADEGRAAADHLRGLATVVLVEDGQVVEVDEALGQFLALRSVTEFVSDAYHVEISTVVTDRQLLPRWDGIAEYARDTEAARTRRGYATARYSTTPLNMAGWVILPRAFEHAKHGNYSETMDVEAVHEDLATHRWPQSSTAEAVAREGPWFVQDEEERLEGEVDAAVSEAHDESAFDETTGKPRPVQ